MSKIIPCEESSPWKTKPQLNLTSGNGTNTKKDSIQSDGVEKVYKFYLRIQI